MSTLPSKSRWPSILPTFAALGLSLAPQSGEAAPEFPPEVFEQLDTGIYWFGDDEAYVKAEPFELNPLFDPLRPTIIYVHGWQKGTTSRQFREAYDWHDNGGPDLYLAQAWIDAGWNVGVMYWNQLADESDVRDAEAKIWTSEGPQGMRWRDIDGEYHNDGPDRSAGELFYDHYLDAMEGFEGDTIRVAGHSLGNQMAIVLTAELADAADRGEIADTLIPERVALLDPYYSAGAHDYLDGQWTGAVARKLVTRAKMEGVAFEIYRSSLVSSAPGLADGNSELMAMGAFVSLTPWYFAGWQLAEKHIAAPWHYFWSFQFDPPTIRGSSEPGLSASTSDARVFELMESDRMLTHYVGVWSKTPSDDSFRLEGR